MRYGVPGKPFEPKPLAEDRRFSDGRKPCLQRPSLPGHTPGHIVFHHPESKLALVGDVLFLGSIGRTDFPAATSSSCWIRLPSGFGR
jgi:glyoxylase-like metal-dependent hydrolase (beta-lactamase superfamily II)